jgi:hypothetical protein
MNGIAQAVEPQILATLLGKNRIAAVIWLG